MDRILGGQTLMGLTEDDIPFLNRFVIEVSGETVRKARAVRETAFGILPFGAKKRLFW